MKRIDKIKSIIDPKYPLVTNLSNVSSIINELNDINWCGFYLVIDNVLYLGPFQGTPACSRIEYGKGVCGTALKEKKTIIVPDVTKIENHISCSSISRSEIVVPIFKNSNVEALLDIDSPIVNRFTNDDKVELEEITEFLSKLF